MKRLIFKLLPAVLIVLPLVSFGAAKQCGSSHLPEPTDSKIKSPWISEDGRGLILRILVHVTEREAKVGSVETSGDSQRLAVSLAQRDNNLLISLLASSLAISENQIEILTGPKNIKKTLLLKLEGDQVQSVAAILENLTAPVSE